MRLGKLIIDQPLAKDKHKLDAVTEFINHSVTILERIAFVDNIKVPCVMMICTSGNFDECLDNIKKIPYYKLIFTKPALAVDADDITCTVERIHD